MIEVTSQSGWGAGEPYLIKLLWCRNPCCTSFRRQTRLAFDERVLWDLKLSAIEGQATGCTEAASISVYHVAYHDVSDMMELL